MRKSLTLDSEALQSLMGRERRATKEPEVEGHSLEKQQERKVTRVYLRKKMCSEEQQCIYGKCGLKLPTTS